MTPREDTWGFMRLQNCILSIAQYIDEFCRDNNISYCLMGGSALGAVRHKGFIPWDDDLDIFMTPDNFDKFKDSFYKKGDKGKYYLQLKQINGLVSTAKLRLNHSMYIEEAEIGKDVHKGVFVDIFILHTCPDNKLKRNWQYFWAKYIVTKGLADRGNKKNGIIGLSMNFLRLLPNSALIGYALKQLYRFRNENSEYLCHFLGHANLKNALYKRDYFRENKSVPFEQTTLSVPSKVEDYLRDRWGDYMKIPPIEEIKKCQHSSDWSDTETFEGFREEGCYKDEDLLFP